MPLRRRCPAPSPSLDSTYGSAAQQGAGPQTVTAQENYQQALNTYLTYLRNNPRSEEAKAIAGKLGLSSRDVDFAVVSKETVEALNRVSQAQPGTDAFADATIDFIGKGVELFGVSLALLLEKATSRLPEAVGDSIDNVMDGYIDFTSKGSMTTVRGMRNRVNTSQVVDNYLDENPGAIDGVNDLMVPSQMRQGTRSE